MSLLRSESTELQGRQLVDEELTPEVNRFDAWFARQAGGALTGLEREVLKSYLYWKIKVEGAEENEDDAAEG